jgi:hypothetical protein
MATFEVRVEGLTGLSIDGSSSPTQDELSEYLKDGVVDVTERILSLRPEQSSDFVRISSASSTQGALASDSGKVISVLRESGTNDDWRPARRISIDKQSRVTDSSSLEYATAYHPVYMMSEDGAVLVFPAPTSSSTQYKIYYINGSPVNLSGDVLDYQDSNIKYFPESKVYLVLLYAACQSLLNNLSSYSISQTVPSLTLPSAPVPPSAPSFSTPTISAITVGSTTVGTMPDIDSTTISNVGTPPTYTAPTVGGVSEELTTTMTATTSDGYGTDADFRDFSMWFTTAAELLEDEEDVELAQAQLQKIGRYIEAYSTQMQSNLNTFNKEDKEYQAKLQEAIQQAQINAQKAIQQAQIDAQKVTQQAQLDSTKTITQAQLDAADAQQEAALLLQKENQEYAAKLQQFSQDVAKYSAEVQAKVQDHAAQINEISAEIQIDSTEYNWMSQRYAALKGQYDQAFGLMAPKEGKD